MRVLIVEDDRRMASLLEEGLAEEGYVVAVARDGEQGLAMAQCSSFDLILLDLTLPKVDGFVVARRLRESANQTPILMLTARDGLQDVVNGLNLGADDYLTKPFSFAVLVARMKAVGRRGTIAQPVRLQLADLALDTETRRVTRQNKPITLTGREYSILELLLRNAGRPVRRQTMLESIWGFGSAIEENTLEVFVRLLRNKVDGPFDRKLVHTVRGIGYCLKLPES